jgi:hypothetical protein
MAKYRSPQKRARTFAELERDFVRSRTREALAVRKDQ